MAQEQIILAQTDAHQEALWAQTLSGFALMKFPPKADPEIPLRMMAAEKVRPDLAIIDIAYFLRRNQNPFEFSHWLGEHAPALRLIWTNGAAAAITENERTVALRRGAMGLLPDLPADATNPARASTRRSASGADAYASGDDRSDTGLSRALARRHGGRIPPVRMAVPTSASWRRRGSADAIDPRRSLLYRETSTWAVTRMA